MSAVSGRGSGDHRERRDRRNRADGLRAATSLACDLRLIAVEEDVPDEFLSASYPDLVEDRLQVILHGVGRDEKGGTDLGRRASKNRELSDVVLTGRESVCAQDQAGGLGWLRGCYDDRDLPRAAPQQRGRIQRQPSPAARLDMPAKGLADRGRP